MNEDIGIQIDVFDTQTCSSNQRGFNEMIDYLGVYEYVFRASANPRSSDVCNLRIGLVGGLRRVIIKIIFKFFTLARAFNQN